MIVTDYNRRQIAACNRMFLPVNALLVELAEHDQDLSPMLFVRASLETCIRECNYAIELAKAPACAEAEQSLLGALLLDYRQWAVVKESLLVADDFLFDCNRRIFQHIARQCDAGKQCDIVTTWASICASNEQEQCEGLEYIGDIANNCPSARMAPRYAQIVRDAAEARRAV